MTYRAIEVQGVHELSASQLHCFLELGIASSLRLIPIPGGVQSSYSGRQICVADIPGRLFRLPLVDPCMHCCSFMKIGMHSVDAFVAVCMQASELAVL